MSDKNVILKLAKVIIAVAWADGELSNDELNSLKDLLFRMRVSVFDDAMQLNSKEWALLDMYLEEPVGAEERARLVAELQNALRSAGQKRLALASLQEMVEADGLVSDNEQALVDEIRQAIESVEVGVVGGLQRLVGGAVQQRAREVAGAPNREAYFDDFIRNKVYYTVSRRLDTGNKTLDIPENKLRKLGLAGGLMAKVAHIDRQVTEEEFGGIVAAFQSHWNVSHEEAVFVAEVAVSAVDVAYDIYRMIRELLQITTTDERRHFISLLFMVAAADGKVALEEHEEIRLIARGLNLSHREFIDAKLSAQAEVER